MNKNKVRKTMINEKVVTTAMLSVVAALTLQTKIGILLSTVATGIDWERMIKSGDNEKQAKEEGNDLADEDANNLGLITEILGSLSSVDPEKLSDLILELSGYAFIEGESCEDSEVFDGDLMMIWQVAFWVAKVNFEPFIQGLMSKVSAKPKKQAALTVKD